MVVPAITPEDIDAGWNVHVDKNPFLGLTDGDSDMDWIVETYAAGVRHAEALLASRLRAKSKNTTTPVPDYTGEGSAWVPAGGESEDMSGQLDIFATAAEDDAIPDTAWPEYLGPWNWRARGFPWHSGYGPHPTWEAFREYWTDLEDVEVYKDREGFIGTVSVVRDFSTSLWLGRSAIRHPTGGSSGPCTYYPAAYRTRQACIDAWTARVMTEIEKEKKRHADDIAWRKGFDRRDREERIRRELEEDDDPETGEEGMEDRFEDLDNEGDG